jgi:hypothetical protein
MSFELFSAIYEYILRKKNGISPHTTVLYLSPNIIRAIILRKMKFAKRSEDKNVKSS